MHPISTAPRDGTVIVLFHGSRPISARAYWNPAMQAWIDISNNRTLHNVRWWDAVA